MQQPQTFPLLRGKGAQAGGERAQARARGRGPRPARSPSGCTARAPTRVGPGSGARGVEGSGLLLPGGRLRGGHGTPAGGQESAPAPGLCAPRPQPALRGDPEQAGGGTLGAAGPGGREPGPQGGGGAGLLEVPGGLPGRGRAGVEVGARFACSLAEMGARLRPALPGCPEYLPRAGLRTLVGSHTPAS